MTSKPIGLRPPEGDSVPTTRGTADAGASRGGLRRLMTSGSVRQFASFFVGSLAGVAADLVLFQLFVRAGAAPGAANAISSGVAITITYVLVTRFTFKTRPSWVAYAAFFGWYAVSIAVFSIGIELVAAAVAAPPLLIKIASLPFSFLANFLMSRLVLTRVARRQENRGPREGGRDLTPVVALVIAWAALLWAGALLYFQVILQSDSVFLDELSRNLFVEGGDWRWWRLPPAAAYVPDMVLYFAAYGILPDVTSRIFAVSFAQVILLGLATSFLVTQLQGRFAPRAQAAAVGFLAVVTLACVHSDLWVYFYSTNNHFAASFFALLALGALLSLLRRFRVVWLVVIAIASLLGAASTSLYTLAFAVPALAVIAVVLVGSALLRISSRRTRLVLAGAAAALLVGLVLAELAVSLITPYGANPDRVGISSGYALRGIQVLTLVLAYLGGGGGPVVLALTLALAAATIYLIVLVVRAVVRRPSASSTEISFAFAVPRRALDSPAGAIALTLSIAAISFVASITVSTLFGGLFDEHGYRYVIPSFLLTGIVAAVVFVERTVSRVAHPGRVLGVVTAVLLVVAIASTPVKVAHPREDAVTAPVAACLRELREDGVTLTDGVSEYWLTRGVAAQVEDVNMLVIWGNLDPSHWMTTAEPVIDPAKYGRHYDFALVHPGETGEPMYVNADQLGQNLPSPSAIYRCNADVEVWTWDDDGLDRALEEHFPEWIERLGVVRG